MSSIDARLGATLVTGGGGFLGSAIVRALRSAEVCDVSSFSRVRHTAVEALGARGIEGDLADEHAVASAVAGHDTVIHCAALAGVWGRARDYERINVRGSQNVLDACRTHGVRRLVLTSSPSVIFDGTSHIDASNDLPYPARYLAHYPRTKAEAERIVLAANGAELATTALRPHLVFGPGDPHLVPRLVARARAGKLARVGSGTNRVSLTFVENAAAAHVDAALALAPGSRNAGRAYFVNQAEPVVLWDWIDEVLHGVGVAKVERRVPARVAYAGGAVCELIQRLFRRSGEPPMTRFVAQQLALEHTYSLAPAQRDFGYRERVGLADATARTIAALRRDLGA